MRSRHSASLQDELTAAGQTLKYDISLSPRRRTLCLQVHIDGLIRVYAPTGTPLSTIRAFILQRRDWVIKTRRKFSLRRPSAVRLLEDGAKLPFLDQNLFLQIIPTPLGRPRLSRIDDGLFLHSPGPSQTRWLLETWYKEQARIYVDRRINYFTALIGCPAPACIRIADQKTRWGSCSVRGTISINWRLMLAPAVIVDYVVVHELCHLLHLNHGDKFWAAVKNILPDYLATRKHLHEIGASLRL